MGAQLSFVASFLGDLLPKENFGQDSVFLRLVLASVVALVVAYLINRCAKRLLPHIAELITNWIATNKKPGDKLLQVRRTETFLNLIASVSHILVVGLCLYIAWKLVNPTTAPLAIIGAGTFFFVIGAATVGPLLRDVTSGVLMVTERWYDIGDHIVVDPFWDLSGVVEKINLRSTKLRTINGEVVWIHNQNIQAVRVTPRGVRTISIDAFVSDLERGRKLINDVLQTMPVGPAMIATPLVIREEEQLGSVWRITAIGQTSPGREWLIEDFAVKAITQADEKHKNSLIVHGPIVRYTDAAAEKRFLRSMHGASGSKTKKDQSGENTA
jgi:moderate conductance mechanosensitive channel